jgi:hypothetical protein
MLMMLRILGIGAICAVLQGCTGQRWKVTSVELNPGANPALDCRAMNNGQYLAGKDLPREVPLNTGGLLCGFATVKVEPLDSEASLSGVKMAMWVDSGMFHMLANRQLGVDAWTTFYETPADADGTATFTTVLIARVYPGGNAPNITWGDLSSTQISPPRGGMPITIYGPDIERKTCRFFAAGGNQSGNGRIICNP